MSSEWVLGLQDDGQELASGLTARQQKMFGEKAQAIYTASDPRRPQHVYQQAVAQKKAAHEGAIAQAVESGAAYAGKPDMLAQSAHAIHESADKLAEFMGWTAENKALYIKKNMSSMYMNGIDSLLAGSDRNPAVAYQALGLLLRALEGDAWLRRCAGSSAHQPDRCRRTRIA